VLLYYDFLYFIVEIFLELPLLNISEEEFRRDFSAHRFIDLRSEYLQRNVIVALGNVGDPVAVPVLKKFLKDGTPLLNRHAA